MGGQPALEGQGPFVEFGAPARLAREDTEVLLLSGRCFPGLAAALDEVLKRNAAGPESDMDGRLRRPGPEIPAHEPDSRFHDPSLGIRFRTSRQRSRVRAHDLEVAAFRERDLHVVGDPVPVQRGGERFFPGSFALEQDGLARDRRDPGGDQVAPRPEQGRARGSGSLGEVAGHDAREEGDPVVPGDDHDAPAAGPNRKKRLAAGKFGEPWCGILHGLLLALYPNRGWAFTRAPRPRPSWISHSRS